MVKPPRVRHSKSQREPMTIDLEPGDVSRVTQDEPEAGETPPAADAAVSGTMSAETVAEALAEGEPVAATSEESPESPAEAESLLDAAIPATEEPTIEAKADMAEAARPARDPEPAPRAFGRDGGASTAKPADSKPAEPVRSAPPRRTGSGLLAGLIGGIAALAIAWALQTAGVLPGGAGTPPADNTEALTQLQVQVTAMKAEISALKERPEPAGIAELRTALGESNTRVDGLAKSLEAMKTDLAALRKAVEAGGAGDGAAVQALEQRLQQIEAAVAALGKGGQADPAALAALGSRIATLESAIAAAASASTATDARIAGIEQSMAALAQKVESLGGQPKVALAIAAAALRSALDRGGTFTAEVETFAAVAPNSPDIAALREIAAKGVATRTEIAAEMPDAANAIIAAGDVASEDVGFLEGLWDGVASLVTVRPIGEVEGAGVPETVARMEAAVQKGDFVKALAEFDTLSEPAKAAGAAFVDKIRTRLAAEQLVEKALADALKAA